MILASNRDQHFSRPTNPSRFWESNPGIIGGQDMEPGREGGTWLAMNKRGQVAMLLNILTDIPETPDKLGRGFLVNDFLTGEATGLQYAKSLQEKAHLYNPFNFVSVELKTSTGTPTMTYYSSESDVAEPIQFEIAGNDEVFAVGNSVYNHPFLKVEAGKREMEEAVRKHARTEQEQELINDLLKILKCRTKYYPDPQIYKQAPTYCESRLQHLSSRFVWIPAVDYGSRTHTIILIDDQNNVKFLEWTLKEPINASDPVWEHVKFEFKLE